MKPRKILVCILAAGLALAGTPSLAQDHASNTVWGEVPAWVELAAHAVLTDASGYVAAEVPVTEGRFAFPDVRPGLYYVVLLDAARATLARSHPAQMTADAVVRAVFGDDPAAAALLTSSDGGIGTTGWVLMGIGAAGLVTALVLTGKDDEGAASPSR